jgi:hypothetical protein
MNDGEGEDVTESSWNSLQNACKILEPLAIATDEAQSDQSSLVTVALSLDRARDRLQVLANASDDAVLSDVAKRVVSSAIASRWKVNFNGAITLAAIALDPWSFPVVRDNPQLRAAAKAYVVDAAISSAKFRDGGESVVIVVLLEMRS